MTGATLRRGRRRPDWHGNGHRPAGPFPSNRHQKCCPSGQCQCVVCAVCHHQTLQAHLTDNRAHELLTPIHPPTTPVPVAVATHAASSLAATLLSTPPRHLPHEMRAAATSTAAALLAPGLKLCAGRARVSSCRLPLRRVAAMASAPNSSFRPEEARSPPALELPTPPLSKVTPFRFGFLGAWLPAQVGA